MGALRTRKDRIECGRTSALWEMWAVIMGGISSGVLGATIVLAALGAHSVWIQAGLYGGVAVMVLAALCWLRAAVWSKRALRK